MELKCVGMGLMLRRMGLEPKWITAGTGIKMAGCADASGDNLDPLTTWLALALSRAVLPREMMC